jgi:Yip1 domain
MSTDSSNAPMMSAGSTSIFQTWINALTKPNEQTYSEIAASPNAKATTAFIWIFVCVLVESFFGILVRGTIGNSLRPLLEKYGYSGNLPDGGVGSLVFRVICGAPLVAVITVVILVIFIAIVQWIAKMFGGHGTFDQLAYVFGAILAPYFLISTVLVLLSAIPLVGLCFSIISLLLFIYIIVLEIMAVKGVHQVGWGGAAGAVLIPFAAVFLFCCCIFAIIFSVAGATIGNVFSTINQSLNP